MELQTLENGMKEATEKIAMVASERKTNGGFCDVVRGRWERSEVRGWEESEGGEERKRKEDAEFLKKYRAVGRTG